jgi:hypothetical protein
LEHHFTPTKYHTTLGFYEPVLRVQDGDTIVTTTLWGPAYEDTFGAYPSFTVTTVVERLLIPSGGSKRFELKFYTSRD